ncbi:MAG: hypothetical protein IPH38_19475 [Candidatus Microthrix sp.]|nr:hypothetical protein [Candidatus Microthrix sp.]MBK7021707.1 hypothetical protein [Candidatus Microthrix sp.]
MILYTTGATGKPKGALFDHHRIMWVGVNAIATCGMRVEAVLHLSHDRRGVPRSGSVDLTSVLDPVCAFLSG